MSTPHHSRVPAGVREGGRFTTGAHSEPDITLPAPSRQPGEAGYVGQSLSVRARDAYDEGRKPLSKVTSADLKAHGIPVSLKTLKWLADNQHITTGEWHHTGRYYAATAFWDLNDVAQQISQLDLDELTKVMKEQPANPGTPVLVNYTVWEGEGRKGRSVIKSDVPATRNGEWLVFDDGTRKRRDSRAILLVRPAPTT